MEVVVAVVSSSSNKDGTGYGWGTLGHGRFSQCETSAECKGLVAQVR
jgi:hypothetical protein